MGTLTQTPKPDLTYTRSHRVPFDTVPIDPFTRPVDITMAQFLLILYEQYQTEPYGPWYTREAYPWEYDARVQKCIQIMNNPTSWNDPSESNKWFQQHIQIWQSRASHIRQQWANQLASQQVKQLAKQQVTQQEEESLYQANTEATAEKSSNIQAISTKNLGTLSKISRQVLSTIPRQIIKQDSHNLEYTTAFWPAISGIALMWHITELSTQEKDLLRRSQPNHHSHLPVKDWTNLEDLEVLV